jgi:hypothetical protein
LATVIIKCRDAEIPACSEHGEEYYLEKYSHLEEPSRRARVASGDPSGRQALTGQAPESPWRYRAGARIKKRPLGHP